MTNSTEPRILVVFFSRTGTTRRVAEGIARACDAELEELREPHSRRGPWGWLRSGYEGTYRKATEPLPLEHDPTSYDLVFVGSPTWNKSLSSPVRGFLQRYGARLPSAALFATCQGQGARDVIAQMAELLPTQPLAELALRESDVLHGPAVSVGELVAEALHAWSTRPGSGRRVALGA